jgi:mono/diheme cytochrome c family protein
MKTCSLSTLVLFCSFSSLGIVLFSACVGDSPDTTVGEQIYTASCAPCHGPDGSGFRDLYPPIRSSAYLDGSISELPCLIRSGITGTIVTGDGGPSQRMPAFPRLSGGESVELITYLQVRWGNSSNLVNQESVTGWLAACP